MRPLWLPAAVAGLLLVVSCIGQGQTPQETTPGPASILPPELIEVEPAPGATERLGFSVCATFDPPEPERGPRWREPVLEMRGGQLEPSSHAVDDRDTPTKETVCFPSLVESLEKGSLGTAPLVREGPMDLSLRYKDQSGQQYRYAWQVRLQLGARQAPPEVHRVRKVHALMEEVGNRLPGFGDYHLDLESNTLNIYLAEAADRQEVEQAIAEVFGRNLPSGGLRVIRPDFPMERLVGWYEEAQNVVWPAVDILWGDRFDERRNRMAFGVLTPWAAHQARQALARTGVPQEAVVFDVPPKKGLNDPFPQVNSPIGVGISLDFKPQVRMGQALLIEVVLKHQRDVAVEFEHGNPFHEDVLVFTPNGDQVWKKLRGFLVGTGGSTLLGPGEEVRLKTYWDLTDLDGFALPPGRYLVRATASISDTVGGYYRPMDLATGPYELIIRR